MKISERTIRKAMDSSCDGDQTVGEITAFIRTFPAFAFDTKAEFDQFRALTKAQQYSSVYASIKQLWRAGNISRNDSGISGSTALRGKRKVWVFGIRGPATAADKLIAEQLSRREEVILRDLIGDTTTVETITRRSDREFDFSFSGIRRTDLPDGGMRFSAWLPLAFIMDRVDWTIPSVANMTDYPDMASSGDWSSVRDSSPEKIWAIFDRYAPL